MMKRMIILLLSISFVSAMDQNPLALHRAKHKGSTAKNVPRSMEDVSFEELHKNTQLKKNADFRAVVPSLSKNGKINFCDRCLTASGLFVISVVMDTLSLNNPSALPFTISMSLVLKGITGKILYDCRTTNKNN